MLPVLQMTAGAAFQLTAPQQHQLRDIAAVLAARLVPVLLAGAAAAALAPPVWLPYCIALALLLTGGLISHITKSVDVTATDNQASSAGCRLACSNT